ncbi:zinc finger protein 610 [Patella vulgata]|uniref:zinc finger protein 610 n=1 Tax=Patella vulgata TaxID=6465 RepID=UPI0021804254|nr:zinc finger protein 610 [Patella vulgata]
MEDSINHQDVSHTEYATIEGSQVTEMIPITCTNINGNTHIATLTSGTSENATGEMDSSEWATIATDNNTLISFRSLPIHLDQLDAQTQLAIRQNLSEDPNNVGQTIMTYDPVNTVPVVTNSLDMIGQKTIVGSDLVTPSTPLENEMSLSHGTVLLLQDDKHTDGILPHVSVVNQVNMGDYSTNTTNLPPPPCSLVFCRVSATISTDVIERIPNYESLIWMEIQTEPEVQMEMSEQHRCTIYGSLDIIIKLNNKLQSLLNGEGGKCFVQKEPEPVKMMCDTQAQCDLLVPHISSRGRQVHQPSRYTGFYKDPVSDIDIDSDEFMESKERRKPRRKLTKPVKLQVLLKDTKNNNDTASDQNKVAEFTNKAYKYSCTICSFKTVRPSHYKKHQRIHESRSVELFKCKKCTFVTIRLSHLNRHELQHSTTVYHCDSCNYSTNQQFYLSRHKRYKHPATKNVFSCTTCNFQTNLRSSYTRHQKIHAAPVTKKMFQCQSCTYKTDVSARYQRHLKHVHGDARPYLCDHCGKAFKRTDTLKAHKVTHLARKDRVLPFTCEICSKGFRSKAHLKEHEISHKQERPYLCHLCGSSFKTQSVQKKHIATIHLNPRSYTCHLCNKQFNTCFTMRRHKKIHDVVKQETEQVLTLSECKSGSLVVPDQTGQPEQPLVQDVIGVSMEETFDQSGDGLRQSFSMPSNEATTALFYLSENLPI